MQQPDLSETRYPVVTDIRPVEAPRPKDGEAVLLKDQIEWAGNDTYAILQDVLESHGIVIKEGKDEEGYAEKQLIIKSKYAKVNIVYTLTDDEYSRLKANDWRTDRNNDLQKRLDIINNIISTDFKQPITKDMLNGNNYVPLEYKEGRREVYEARFIAYERRQKASQQNQAKLKQESDTKAVRQRIYNNPNTIAEIDTKLSTQNEEPQNASKDNSESSGSSSVLDNILGLVIIYFAFKWGSKLFSTSNDNSDEERRKNEKKKRDRERRRREEEERQRREYEDRLYDEYRRQH